MTRISGLLCLAALCTTAAVAQNSATSSLPYDPSLANIQSPAPSNSGDWSYTQQTNQAKPSAARPQNTASQSQYRQPVPAYRPSAARPMTAEAQPAAAEFQPRLQSRSEDQLAVLPTATVLRLKLVRPISTANARPGERFFATLTAPVQVNGRTVIPAGTSVTCRVDAARAGRRFAGKPMLNIKALSAQVPSGDVIEFSASVIDTANPRRFDVDQEGRIRGTRFSPMDKVEMGSLAGAGLVAGAVIAGPEGLLIGTASGAVLAAGHMLIKQRDLTLPTGTELIFELDSPATIFHSQMGG